MKQNSDPISQLIGFVGKEKGKYILSIVFAILGVAAGFVPFFVISKIVLMLMSGEIARAIYIRWCIIAALGFCGNPVW
jgi:ATP-binding cassette subfamily B protein